AFKNALADERAELSDAHSPRVAPFRTRLRQPLSLVASLLLCGLGLQVSYGLLAGRSVAPDAAAIDSFILVENTRGAERPPLSAQPPYLFQIDAGPGTANTRVTLDLRAADGRPLLHLAEVPVDGNG